MHPTRLRNAAARLGLAGSASILAAAMLGGCAHSATTSTNHQTTGSNAPTQGATSSAGGGTQAPGSPPPPAVTETNPPGDIPDSTVYVPFHYAAGHFTVKVPEGWARQDGPPTVFTDKLNSITLQTVGAAQSPSVASARKREVPRLQSSMSKVSNVKVSAVQRHAGQAVLITFEADSKPNDVTGKVVREAVERYEFWRSGVEAVVTLAGPKGADNVDPWRTVTDSIAWG